MNSDTNNEVEYLDFRCCMCPNGRKEPTNICPTGPGKNKITPCRFVQSYIDDEGRIHRVMKGRNISYFKGFYKNPTETGWQRMDSLPWQDTFDKAQKDLNRYAKENCWLVVSELEEDFL